MKPSVELMHAQCRTPLVGMVLYHVNTLYVLHMLAGQMFMMAELPAISETEF